MNRGFHLLGNFIRHIHFTAYQSARVSVIMCLTLGGHSIVKNAGGGVGSIVWGLGFWLGKDILGFFKNIDLDNS